MNRKMYRSLGLWLVAVMMTALAGGAGAIEIENVPVTASPRPFFAAITDLAAHGYVEEEYFVTAIGDVFEYDADGQVQVQQQDVGYKSRMLVRRPQAAAFNGVVLVEMMNPTAGHDIDFEWHFTRDLLLGQGYVWVGLTIKDVAINALREWDPARYGSLEMPDRGLAYDLLAEVGTLLKDDANPDNPLAGFGVDMLIATGYSQSSDYLTTFSNEFHETAIAADGSHSFDGYLLTGGNAAARSINNTDLFLYTDDRRLNRVHTPLIRVQSETEVAIFFYSSIDVRQPDSEVFRIYEIAGGSHGDAEVLTSTGAVIAREYGLPPVPPCGNPLSPLSIGAVHRASLDRLVRWIADGEAPPPSRLIELDGDRKVVRDAFGNALGGVRLPTIDVPLGTFAPGNSGPLPCPVAGSFTAFDAATLASLYPSHGRYVAKVVASALRGVRGGLLLPSDALDFVLEAAHSDVGR